MAALPGLGFNHRYVPLRQSEPQAEDLCSRHSFHVARPADGLVVFPHQQTRRKGAQAPSRFVRQRDIGMLLVVNIKRLKKLTKSRDRRVSLDGAPSVGGTECQFPRALRKELGCSEFNAEVDQSYDEQDHTDPAQHANLLLIRRCSTTV